MIDGLRRDRIAMLIDVHDDVLCIHSHIFDVSDDIDFGSLSFSMTMASSSYTSLSKLFHEQRSSGVLP